MSEIEILLARNKFKIQHIVYFYEAELNILQTIADKTSGRKSISKVVHAIIAKVLLNNKKAMKFLNEKDMFEINELDKYITSNT